MKSKTSFHILIVDDEKLNIDLAAACLKKEGYKISFALSGEAALNGIAEKEVDLILLDINMPKMDGFSVCEALKRDPKTKDIPIIFLTAQSSMDRIARAFEVGGVDYIAKPFGVAELKARVKTHLQNIKYLQEIQHKQAKFAQLSITDPLTKLHNAFYFDSQIKMYQKKAEEFWVMYIVLEKFDKINNIYGFYHANKILRTFAKTLQKNVISNAIVARLHGVHFAILLKGYERHTIDKLYKKLVASVQQHEDLKDILHLHVVIHNVKDKEISLASLYKKLQEAASSLQEQGKSHIYLQ